MNERLAWIHQWKKTNPLLEEQSRIELANMTLEERQKQIANLLDLAYEFRQPRLDNGLVKLQRSFAKMFSR